MKSINRIEKLESGRNESKYCRCNYQQRGRDFFRSIGRLKDLASKSYNNSICSECGKQTDKHSIVFTFADAMRIADKHSKDATFAD
jgi:hypothetical protein